AATTDTTGTSNRCRSRIQPAQVREEEPGRAGSKPALPQFLTAAESPALCVIKQTIGDRGYSDSSWKSITFLPSSTRAVRVVLVLYWDGIGSSTGPSPLAFISSISSSW